ncbi:MAG: hypothetical protein VW644_06580, partial [Alphaproteobacteria bacterium]
MFYKLLILAIALLLAWYGLRYIGLRDAARRLLAGLTPADRVALVTVPFGGLAVDLTADHARVLQALGSLTAKGLRSESVDDAQ